MARLHRIFPKPGLRSPQLVNGTRTYDLTTANYHDVDAIDSAKLQGNSAIFAALVGTTANRPALLPTSGDSAIAAPGVIYIDTDVNKVLIFDGLIWRDLLLGTAA